MPRSNTVSVFFVFFFLYKTEPDVSVKEKDTGLGTPLHFIHPWVQVFADGSQKTGSLTPKACKAKCSSLAPEMVKAKWFRSSQKGKSGWRWRVVFESAESFVTADPAIPPSSSMMDC